MFKFFYIVPICCLLAISNSLQAAESDLSRNLAATCANCHGTNGHAVESSDMEPLAGMARDRLFYKLKSYRNGERPSSVMQQILKGYTEAQLERIAAYFAAQKK